MQYSHAYGKPKERGPPLVSAEMHQPKEMQPGCSPSVDQLSIRVQLFVAITTRMARIKPANHLLRICGFANHGKTQSSVTVALACADLDSTLVSSLKSFIMSSHCLANQIILDLRGPHTSVKEQLLLGERLNHLYPY